VAIAVAIAAGVGSALAYGAGTAGQHASAYTGEVDAGRLMDLLRNPRWLLASAGDVLGIGLQVVALSNGPVILVQPLLVLSLPVAVALRAWFGGPRASTRDLRICALLLLALGAFFALLGEPSRGRVIDTTAAAWTAGAAFVLGLLAVAVTRRACAVVRAAVLGVVAGCWFGVVSVLIEAVTSEWQEGGVRGFGHADGWVPLTGVVILAVVGYVLVQIGFQVGPLGASFPANLICDPLVAVILGAVLLGEHVPLGGAKSLGYVCCLVAVGWAAVRLANPETPGQGVSVGVAQGDCVRGPTIDRSE
jgi:hypothetical protein